MEANKLYINDNTFSIYKDILYNYADTLLDIPSNYKEYRKAMVMLDKNNNIIANYIDDDNLDVGVYIKCYNKQTNKYKYIYPGQLKAKITDNDVPIGISVKWDNMRKYTMGISDVVDMDPTKTNINTYHWGLLNDNTYNLLLDTLENNPYDLSFYKGNGDTAKTDRLGKINTEKLCNINTDIYRYSTNSDTNLISPLADVGIPLPTNDPQSNHINPTHLCKYNYRTEGTDIGDWWLPSLGELLDVFNTWGYEVRTAARDLSTHGYKYFSTLLDWVSRSGDAYMIWTSTLSEWFYTGTSSSYIFVYLHIYKYSYYDNIYGAPWGDEYVSFDGNVTRVLETKSTPYVIIPFTDF